MKAQVKGLKKKGKKINTGNDFASSFPWKNSIYGEPI